MSHLGIITAWNYAWSVLTACFVLGIAIYLLDRKFGIHIYRFGYDFFHKNPMPTEVERGFLCNQSTNRGVGVALFLSTVYSLYMVWELGFAMDFIAEFFVWLGMPPALVGGFWSGRWVYKMLLRRSSMLDKLDTISESVENMGVAGITKNLKERGASFAAQVMPARKEPTKPAASEPPPEEPKVDFKDMMRRYTRK